MSTATMMTTAVNPFAMTASNKSGNYETCPQANYPAVVAGLIDLGTHDVTYDDGNTGKAHKAALLIQIGEAYAKMTDGKPFVFLKEINISSFGKKSAARKIAEAVEGKVFADNETYMLTQLIGKSCQANIKHNPGKEGKVYANLDAITSLTIGVPQVPLAMERIEWFHGCGQDFPAIGSDLWSYGQTLKQIYQDSDEYRSEHGGPAAGKDVPAKATQIGPDGDEDGIPF